MCIYIYIYTNLQVNAIVRLPHPRSGDSQGQETCITVYTCITAYTVHINHIIIRYNFLPFLYLLKLSIYLKPNNESG